MWLFWKLVPIAATHCMACSHRPFDFVWRFTVRTSGALRHFVRPFCGAVDLDASFAVDTVNCLCHFGRFYAAFAVLRMDSFEFVPLDDSPK